MQSMFTLCEFAGLDGFLPESRASFMLDFVFLAMFLVVPVMGLSIYLVKYRQMYAIHKKIQVLLGLVLLVAVIAFEVDLRINGWTDRAADSPYINNYVWPMLYIHLFFAIPTALLWIYVIVAALRKFPKPVAPCAYSAKHRFWGKVAAIEMAMTALTGWIFYVLAFVAT